MTEKDYPDDTSTVRSDTDTTSTSASPSLPSFSPAASLSSSSSSSSLDIDLTPPPHSTSQPRFRLVQQPAVRLEHDYAEIESERSALLHRLYVLGNRLPIRGLWQHEDTPIRRRLPGRTSEASPGPDYDSDQDSAHDNRRARLQRRQEQEQEQEQEQQQRQRRQMNAVDERVGRIFYGVIGYIFDLFHGALIYLRPVFSALIALAVFLFLVGVVIQCMDHFRSEVHTRFVCKLPAASFFVKCPVYYQPTRTTSSSSPPPRRSFRDRIRRKMRLPGFADLINGQASHIEMIADSVGGHLMPEFEAEANRKMEQEEKVMGTESSGEGGAPRTEESRSSGNHQSKGQGQGDRRREDDSKNSNKGNGNHNSKNDDGDPYGITKYTEQRGVPLPVLIKKTELAVEDLKVLVKYSALPPETRDMVVTKLEQYVLRARVTSKQMQSLHSRAEGSLDGLAIRNSYLMQELKRVQKQQETLEESQGWWDRIKDQFSGGDTRDQALAASEQKLQLLYKASMEDARKRMLDIVHQTQDVLKSLEHLDQTMRSINELATQEGQFQKEAHAKLSRFWTLLGQNRLQEHHYRENLEVLDSMDGQRMAATGQIHTALLRITKFGEDMGVLREKIVEAVVDNPERNPFANILHPPGSGAGDNERLESYTLMGHIEQIESVTKRLKDRNFRIDEEFRAKEDRYDNSH